MPTNRNFALQTQLRTPQQIRAAGRRSRFSNCRAPKPLLIVESHGYLRIISLLNRAIKGLAQI